MRDGAAQNEAARLHAGDLVDLRPRIGLHEFVDGAAERARVAEQGRDVAKLDAGLGIIRDGPDMLDEIEAPCRPRELVFA